MPEHDYHGALRWLFVGKGERHCGGAGELPLLLARQMQKKSVPLEDMCVIVTPMFRYSGHFL